MKTFTKTVLAFLLSLSLLAMAGAVIGEDGPRPQKRFEILRRYLERDLIIHEGAGLREVRLGQTFETAARAWGPPKRKKERFAFSDHRRWYYRPEDATEIVLSGGRRIERITWRGTHASSYRTRAGAQFGMALPHVASLYGSPRRATRSGALEYPALGIKFYFKNRQLYAIEVFAPQPRR